MRQYQLVKELILGKLRDELPAQFTYHNVDHTNDVIQATEMLADGEGVDGLDKELLLTAAVLHDTGFLMRREEHEIISCQVARVLLPGYGYDAGEVERVCELVMATRIPQSPKDKFAEILCDADLDYLGRSDFLPLSERLFNELKNEGLLQHLDEWNIQQADFVGKHAYFTKTAIDLRSARQHEHLELIKSKITNPLQMKIPDNPVAAAVKDTVYIVAGIMICGFALKSFLVPNAFFDGGVTGISLLISELYHINIAYVIIPANIPFIIMGIFQVNGRFAWKTLAAIIGVGICLQFIPYPQSITHDKLLVCIFGGVFMGTGIGLAIRGGCALDGIEVLALFTLKRSSFTISEIILGINVFIFSVAAFKLGLPTALYSIITYYAASHTINFVIEGLEEYTGFTIISGQSELIKEKLVLELGRGITIYKGERGFLKDSFDVSHPVDIIFTVVTRLEVRRLRNTVASIDPKAFMFTSTIKEAAGGVLKKRARH